MFLPPSRKTQHNNQIRILSAGLLNNEIDFDLIMAYLKQQQNYTLIAFLTNYRDEQQKLRAHYDSYQKVSMMKKEAYIDYHIRSLDEESILCLYHLFQLPYANRVELAPYLLYPKNERIELATQYPEYAEILSSSLYLRETIHAILINKNDSYARDKAHQFFAYLGPIMPFDREKYQKLLDAQNHQYRLFKEWQENYELKIGHLKIEVLKYLVDMYKKCERMAHLYQASTQQINAVRNKHRYVNELSMEDDSYGQFVDIENAEDIILLEIDKQRSHSPTSVITSLSSRSVFKIDMKIEEEAYIPSAFTISF